MITTNTKPPQQNQNFYLNLVFDEVVHGLNTNKFFLKQTCWSQIKNQGITLHWNNGVIEPKRCIYKIVTTIVFGPPKVMWSTKSTKEKKETCSQLYQEFLYGINFCLKSLNPSKPIFNECGSGIRSWVTKKTKNVWKHTKTEYYQTL